MGPYGVLATVPVTVRAATPDCCALALGAADRRPPVPLAIGCDVPADTVGGLRPAESAARQRVRLEREQRGEPGGGAAKGQQGTAHDRNLLAVEGDVAGQKSKDSWWMRGRGMPAATSDLTAVSVIPAGPHTYAS